VKLKNKPRGTVDIFPPRSSIYQKIQQISSYVLKKNNYQLVIFPTYEFTELFTSSLGSTSDVVNKEMFTFFDRKGRSLTLRPEGTASTARLICQNKLVNSNNPLKLYYWGSMFRYERPQKGRYREFYQLGVELINASGIIADFEILRIAKDLLETFAIKDFTFQLNYLGSEKTRERYKKELKSFFSNKTDELCSDCQKRYQTNILRILDCSYCFGNFAFPSYQKSWDNEDNGYIEKLNQILDSDNFPYTYNYKLVRGLDYYTGLVFEVKLMDKNAILGGGRYDELIGKIGDKSLAAAGFAIGIDRLVNYLLDNFINNSTSIDIFFLALTEQAFPLIFTLQKKLKKYNYVSDYNLTIKKIKNPFKVLDYYLPRLTIIIGEEELKSDKILIKDCQKKKDFFVDSKKLIKWIDQYLTKSLD